MSSINS